GGGGGSGGRTTGCSMTVGCSILWHVAARQDRQRIIDPLLRMPQFITDALILRTYKLGESDRIVVFLTRDRGKKRGVAKNARQSRQRFGGALEPLTCGRVSYVERERRDPVRRGFRGPPPPPPPPPP